MSSKESSAQMAATRTDSETRIRSDRSCRSRTKRGLEEHLQGPLHRARAARSDHRVASVDVGGRSDLPERAAPHARAQEPAEIDAIGDVEDLPARLNPRIPLDLELLED